MPQLSLWWEALEGGRNTLGDSLWTLILLREGRWEKWSMRRGGILDVEVPQG